MPVLSARDLRHAYGDRSILDGVSLAIARGERVGLIGQNGAGKSTLAAILCGAVEPDGGEVVLRGGCDLAYLAQEVDFGEHRTPRDYIQAGLAVWSEATARYEASTEALAEAPGDADLLEAQAGAADDIERHGGWDVMHRVDEIAGHLGIVDLDVPVADMSGGERRRVALARVLIARPSLAILDEPTNHLDVAAIEWLEDHLISDHPGAVLLITHDRAVLDRVAQRTLELDDGAIHEYPGGWERYLEARAERLAHAARREANRQNQLRRELEWLRRSPKARTTKSQARIDRVEALRDATPTPQQRDARFEFAATRAGKTVIELRDLRVSIAGRRLIDGLDLALAPGDRVGIIGANGAGKTSLLRVLLGQLEPESGRAIIGATARLAHFDQERAELDDDRTVAENVVANRDVVRVAGREMKTVSYLARMLFPADKQRQKVATLSGGERARVSMARFLLSPANVLLLDEPTNDLDVATLAALEEMLIESGATVLFVTHDRYFLDRVATTVLSFEGDGRVVRYADSAQAIAALRAARRPRPPEPAAKREPPRPAAPAAAGLTFSEEHELERLMPLIEEAEAALAAIEAELADPDLYARRGAEVPALQARRDAAQALVDERVARWEELEGKRSS